jgi:aspartyl aminopeptidase
MEIYGGVLLNSWLDRGLGLAGRVAVRTGDDIEMRLVLDDRPLMVIPQLAIHLDREIMTKGLKLDPQKHLTPMWALDEGADGDRSADQAAESDPAGSPSEGALRRHVAGLLEVEPARILSWDLMAFDTQPPEIIGRDRDLFASGRIDNLLSSFCAVRALAESAESETDYPRTPVVVLYDHEEVGSESATGASGMLLAGLLERIATAQGASRTEFLAGLQRSIVLSADGAHATHPNYAERHEPSHHIGLNGGIVVKRNANQRYATDAASEAVVVAACEQAGVPVQYYIHRNDLPCGSTIGPMTAARLGVSTVDIGAPQLAMHSARETAGVADIAHLHRAIGAVLARP